MSCDPHLFWPAVVATARRMRARGERGPFVVGCALCHRGVDLLAENRTAGEPRPRPGPPAGQADIPGAERASRDRPPA